MADDMKNDTILILGGWGLVGRAICHELLKLNPKRLIVCSLLEVEADTACSAYEQYKQQLAKASGLVIDTEIVSSWGDIFASAKFKDVTTRDNGSREYLDSLISETFDDLNTLDLSENLLYKLLIEHKPDIVIDCVNTATGVAYQDIYKSVIELRKSMGEMEALLETDSPKLIAAAQTMLQRVRENIAGIYLPRLIRHVQLLYKGMEAVSTNYYLKIGTTGTGGMGLNIPYTHSEEKPSQKLLSKSAVGGAHSLLLYLMSKTPDMAHTMEFKPAASIGWKRIEYGEIKAKGKPISLYDNAPDQCFNVKDTLEIEVDNDKIQSMGKALSAAFIDTGENGLFSAGEFSAITTTGQMEYITPEEIATMVVEELKGGNSGYDIMSNLSNSVMRSTYRAGFMRHHAIDKLQELQKLHNDDSVAFEILGPPRLSKLLYEAYLIKKIYKTPENVLGVSPKQMSRDFLDTIKASPELRSRIISIGIPILLEDGVSMIRGPKVVIPPYRGSNEVPSSPEKINSWAHDGWVDLRESNMEMWKQRMENLLRVIKLHDWDVSDADTSSAFNRKDFIVEGELNIGEVVGWIFNVEEKGARKFYDAGFPQTGK